MQGDGVDLTDDQNIESRVLMCACVLMLNDVNGQKDCRAEIMNGKNWRKRRAKERKKEKEIRE